jgi:hypothetical protein
MSNPVFVVLDPFLEMKRYLRGSSEEDSARIMKALTAVQAFPRRPKGFVFKKLQLAGNYKVEIPLEDDTLAVTYEIWPFTQEIRIVEVRELGGLRKVRDVLTGLLGDIVPRKDP